MHSESQFNTLVQAYHNLENPTERLGQYLMNRMPVKVTDPEVYYCEDDAHASQLYFDRYVVGSLADIATWKTRCDSMGLPRNGMEETRKKIKAIEFKVIGTTTYCFITTHKGFTLEGRSGCADPNRFNVLIGKRLAYNKAFADLCDKEAYLHVENRKE